MKSLQKCIQSSVELGPLIKRCERKLHMYVIYCQNKPVSEHIVAEHLGYFEEIRSKLRHKLLVSKKHDRNNENNREIYTKKHTQTYKHLLIIVRTQFTFAEELKIHTHWQ